MLASRELPASFRAWNDEYQAPFGAAWAEDLDLEARLAQASAAGPFAFQPNSTTRSFEYPWAFSVRKVPAGLSVLEIGGALSGFQFVLARAGAAVTNVDPFLDYGGEESSPGDPEALHDRLNSAFETDVRLIRATLPEAQLPDDSLDRAYCISTLEHLPREEISRTAREVRRILRHGGEFVLTVDLFLDLDPFTTEKQNRWGANVSVAWLVEESGMHLVEGERAELLGFPEFDPERIRDRVENYLVGETYPVLTQALVLRK
jgi:SAM-dependent methyltransferase